MLFGSFGATRALESVQPTRVYLHYLRCLRAFRAPKYDWRFDLWSSWVSGVMNNLTVLQRQCGT